MASTRILAALAALVLPGARTAAADETPAPSREWSGSFSVAGYLVPDGRDFVQPTLRVDRGRLHLEARYDYEALDTGSVWIGCNFSAGEKVTFDFTPMVGGVFGDLDGVAPGYEMALAWRKLDLYTEGEFVFDHSDESEDYFYSWSELGYSPTDRFRLGFAVQRTKTYETDFDIQRGLFFGVSFERATLAAYVFNPDEDPTFVLSASREF